MVRRLAVRNRHFLAHELDGLAGVFNMSDLRLFVFHSNHLLSVGITQAGNLWEPAAGNQSMRLPSHVAASQRERRCAGLEATTRDGEHA